MSAPALLVPMVEHALMKLMATDAHVCLVGLVQTVIRVSQTPYSPFLHSYSTIQFITIYIHTHGIYNTVIWTNKLNSVWRHGPKKQILVSMDA